MTPSPAFSNSGHPPPLPASGPVTIPVPEGLHVDLFSWQRFATGETDALIIGEEPAVWRVLTSVWPALPKPRFWCDGRQRLALPIYRGGTLILQNVHGLETCDQQRLLEWCGGNDVRSRMIATATRSLEQFVEADAFSRKLYDRLKTVQLRLL